VDFNGNQWFEDPNCSFNEASKGSTQSQPGNCETIGHFQTINACLALAL